MKQLACALQSLLSSSIPLRPHPASSSKAHASHSRIQLEVESKPQRLEQRSPAIQGGSNWISLAMVKPKCPRPARNRKPRSCSVSRVL
uniref:Uncharacterized protein n=1 Tax=Phytophthora fragariae TaxID=53985 RepID=A0A6A3E7K4_9STRA|nr:hypothetical protein PF009_g23937 [Phytophthora fragariae]